MITNKEVIKGLLKRYEGLKVEDLSAKNPLYSCVICTKMEECGYPEGCCEKATHCDPEVFARRKGK